MRNELLLIAYLAALMLAVESILFGGLRTTRPEYRIDYLIPVLRLAVWACVLVRVMWVLAK